METEKTEVTESAQHQVEQLLTFTLHDQEYAVDILRVQEIRGWAKTTPIPNTPLWLKGIINLRGTIIPIVDLRERFSFPKDDYGPTTVVIVLRVTNQSSERIVGIVVDAVSDVLPLKHVQLQEPPNFGSAIDTRFIRGLVTHDERLLIVIEIDQMLDFDMLS